MSNVTLKIGGRDYVVACAEGEEDRVASLGALIDDKVRSIGGAHSEPRQLLYAALLLADELSEVQARNSSGPSPQVLETIADRLESCAAALEQAGGNA
jgi:cell division protein ZapA